MEAYISRWREAVLYVCASMRNGSLESRLVVRIDEWALWHVRRDWTGNVCTVYSSLDFRLGRKRSHTDNTGKWQTQYLHCRPYITFSAPTALGDQLMSVVGSGRGTISLWPWFRYEMEQSGNKKMCLMAPCLQLEDNTAVSWASMKHDVRHR